jgi:hypothetical protein
MYAFTAIAWELSNKFAATKNFEQKTSQIEALHRDKTTVFLVTFLHHRAAEMSSL